jgi:hypothetical protein
MNKYLKFLPAVLLALGLLCLLPACTSIQKTDPNTGATNTVHVPDVAQMQLVAKSAVYVGTTVWLKGVPPGLPAHPEDREAFETARTSLQTLIAAGSFSAGDLSAALQSLPIKELQGDTGSLIVGEAVILWDQYGRQLASLDKALVFNTYILPVAKSILDGLNLALGPPAPAAH